MPQNQRPPGSNVVDEFIFIRIPNVGTLSPDNKRGIAPDRTESPYRRIHSPGNHALSAFLQTARLLDLSRSRRRHQVLPPEKEINLCDGLLYQRRHAEINPIFT